MRKRPVRQRSLSAGVIVVRFQDREPLYLLLRAYHYWDFPKGQVEPGEEPLQAAIREVEEETGLTHLEFRWGEQFRETPPYGKGKVARYYVAETPEGKVCLPISPQLGCPEHQEYRWLDYPKARSLLVPRLQVILDWAHRLVSNEASY